MITFSEVREVLEGSGIKVDEALCHRILAELRTVGWLPPMTESKPLRERRLEDLHKPAVKAQGRVRVRAILDAANLASTWNCVSTHSLDLGDCLLAKLNLLEGPIRPNPYRSSGAKKSAR